MAYAKQYALKRSDIATLTSSPYSRGLTLNGEQVEIIFATKLTGDTSATVTLVGITRPTNVYVIPELDSGGSAVNTNTATTVTFAQTSTARQITVSSLGSWTRGILIVTGRMDA